MATYQVPGWNPANQDALGEGCWAEKSGQKLLVNNVGDKVDFTEFGDTVSRKEMSLLEFGKEYSDSGWLWHDKTPFPRAA